MCFVVNTNSSDLMQLIKESWEHDTELKVLINKLQSDPTTFPKYTWSADQL